MNISEYKGILFIEDTVDCKIIKERLFSVETSGFGNQLKNFDDLKELVYKKLKSTKENYNIVYNFQYYQKQNILSLDDIVFHASGNFAFVENDDYLKLKKMRNNSSIEQLFSIKNSNFYKSKPVQIDKLALYKLKNKYLGQCKLINFSKEEIRKVKLELQSINSFGELSTKINSLEIIRKKDDSNFTFGDEKTIVFEEDDVVNYKIKILSVITSVGEIEYDENDKEMVERFIPFITKVSEDQFKYMQLKQFGAVFKQYNTNINSNIPRCYKNTMIDFEGNFDENLNQELLSIDSYILENLETDFDFYIKEKQENERIKRQKMAENKEKSERMKRKMKTILPLIVLAFVVILGAFSLFKEISKTPIEKFQDLTYDSFINSFKKMDLELVDYTEVVNNKRPGLGQVECDSYYLIMKDNIEIGHFYKDEDVFKMVLSYIDTQDDAENKEYFRSLGSNLNAIEISYIKIDEGCKKIINVYYFERPQDFEDSLENEMQIYDENANDIVLSVAPDIADCLKKADLLSENTSDEIGYKTYENGDERVYLNAEEDFFSYEEQITLPKILE